MAKYKLSKQIIEERGFKAEEGEKVKINLADEEIEGKITKIEGDQLFIEG